MYSPVTITNKLSSIMYILNLLKEVYLNLSHYTQQEPDKVVDVNSLVVAVTVQYGKLSCYTPSICKIYVLKFIYVFYVHVCTPEEDIGFLALQL